MCILWHMIIQASLLRKLFIVLKCLHMSDCFEFLS